MKLLYIFLRGYNLIYYRFLKVEKYFGEDNSLIVRYSCKMEIGRVGGGRVGVIS